MSVKKYRLKSLKKCSRNKFTRKYKFKNKTKRNKKNTFVKNVIL